MVAGIEKLKVSTLLVYNCHKKMARALVAKAQLRDDRINAVMYSLAG
jgi:hypothetical protein